MRSIYIGTKRSAVCRFSISLLAVAGLAAAQDQTPHSWRSVNDPPPAAAQNQQFDQGATDQAPNYSPAPNDSAQNNQAPYPDAQAAQAPQSGQNPQAPQGGQYPNAQQQPGQYNGAPPPPAYGQAPASQGNYPPPNGNYAAPVPPRLTIKPGTYATVRINQWLSSDRNQQGDTFTAILEQPIVVDGFVVAQRGQTVYGRVTEAQKAGRVEGTSRLGVELTQLTLVDGEQAPIQSQMINRNGPTSVGRDAAAIGGTTALGAIIGAGAGLGRGAAIGAGAGAAAGVIGVLLTRGRPTVIYPESVLTFQLQAPVEISTSRAPQAFQYVNTQQDYARGGGQFSSRPPAASCYNCGAVPPPPPAYGYGAYYPPYAYGGYPYYGGFSVFVGPGYGYAYGRGFYGGYRFRR